ncbi:MAG: hypothetical protein PHR16_03425 [Methylovulum sp.]|nr:hypothetical protein [Methylovulum sp.]
MSDKPSIKRRAIPWWIAARIHQGYIAAKPSYYPVDFSRLLVLLVPKLLLGNAVLEALASRILEAGASRTWFPSWSLGTSKFLNIAILIAQLEFNNDNDTPKF